MKSFYYILLFGLSLQSCMTPVNLHYENATLLEKGETEIKGSVSVNSSYEETYYCKARSNSYNNPYKDYSGSYYDANLVTTFVSGSVGTRISDKRDFKLRYTLMLPNDNKFSKSQCLEFDLKKSIKKGQIATGTSIQLYNDINSIYYTPEEHVYIGLTKKYFFTPISNEKNDWTVIPKMHFIGSIQGINFYPAFSTNVSFNCKNFIIRPEAGVLLRPKLEFDIGDGFENDETDLVFSFGTAIILKHKKKLNQL